MNLLTHSENSPMKRRVTGKRPKCSRISSTGVETTREQEEEDKKCIKIITKDLIRDLLVRNDTPKVYSAVLSHDKFKDIIKRSKVLTPEERWQLVLERDNEELKILAESQARKEEARKWELIHGKGQKLSKIDQEAAARTNHILTRAELLKAEQEDEVKAANRLILSTKCHAIRCAQIAEKSLTRKELEMEERRLEDMMEKERVHLIASEEKKREEERLKKIKYVEYVKQQIQENESKKVVLAQQLEQESKIIKRSMIQSNFEAVEAIQEYMRQKAEREAERELELMRMKQAREKEITRLRALQERQQDLQAKEDELKAKRIQEEVEREWRKKERELARRHAKEEEELKKARQVQIEQRKRTQAIDVALEKREFDRIISAQIEEMEKIKEEEEKRKEKTTKHRSALLSQINEKVGERARERQRVFEEGVAIALEEKKRQERIKNVMKNKVDELRIHKVPEVYIKEIERQLKIADMKD
ncbi:hypothetical protein J437_LFUL013868 [Ladona fulva]|uniref:Cilia- and flagella-associated protein 45 n=1 Tax=Ladona fulva TaxID=123851 RepID=A0A8K0KMK0_LADFU|nr:hypothetical protein J437_LFUL013868 [Ladona fulva]